MARKGWDQLKAKTRQRYEKAGVTKGQYESGASLKAARGHANTPERPRGFDPAQYPKYVQTRAQLIKALQAKKNRMFTGRPRWNEDRSLKNIRGANPSIKELRWAVDQATEEELYDAFRDDPKQYKFLGYH